MIIENLYKQVLIDPALSNCNNLYIVSGYASATMAYHHLNDLLENLPDLKINLIIGMARIDGIAYSNHKGFQGLQNNYSKNFKCSYIYQNHPVHSKIYTWCNAGNPLYGFIGSANYTQTAFFGNKQREVLASCDPNITFEYFKCLIPDSIDCNFNEIENYVKICNDKDYARGIRREIEGIDNERFSDLTNDLENVSVSFLDREGDLPSTSGLNWGQREGREKNQAYIRLVSSIYNTEFFPPRGIEFTVRTDDAKIFVCKRAQDNGKAIETPLNNSYLGEYFRYRLGLSNGQFIKKQDLINYGRTDVTFYKIDDETFLMDFSV